MYIIYYIIYYVYYIFYVETRQNITNNNRVVSNDPVIQIYDTLNNIYYLISHTHIHKPPLLAVEVKPNKAEVIV